MNNRAQHADLKGGGAIADQEVMSDITSQAELTEAAAPIPAAPRAIAERDRRTAELFDSFQQQYGDNPPEEAQQRKVALYGQICVEAIDAMTDQELADETARLRAIAEAAPEGVETQIATNTKRTWEFDVARRRSETSKLMRDRQLAAANQANAALTRCDYLGGMPDAPSEARGCCVEVDPGIEVLWGPAKSATVLGSISWSAVTAIEVGANGAADRYTATRLAALGPLGLAFKKSRREATLVLQTDVGAAYFTVHGRTPLQLEAALAPARACIGEPDGSKLQDAAIAEMSRIVEERAQPRT